MNAANILYGMLPEHIVLLLIILLMVFEILKVSKESSFYIALTGILATIAVLATQYSAKLNLPLFEGHVIVDIFSICSQSIIVLAAALILLLMPKKFQETKFYLLFLSSLYGAMLMVSSGTFLTLFISLEIMSIPVYAMVMSRFKTEMEVEAAFKYIILGGVSSAILLLGISFLYGNSGDISIINFHAVKIVNNFFYLTGFLLVIIAIFFKASIAPFHAWAPDVYHGATQQVTTYMAVIVKAAVFFAMIRIFGKLTIPEPLMGVMIVLPLLSIIWGNVAAIFQTSFKRMMAYSSIAHAGYVMFAFLDTSGERSSAVAFYVLAYALMSILAFAAVIYFADTDEEVDDLEQFKGIFSVKPVASFFMIIAIFSLAGIPPFPGFYAKFFIFKNVVAAGHPLLALTAFVCSFIGIFFYIRVLVYIYMYPEKEKTDGAVRPYSAWVMNAMILSVVIILMITVMPENFIQVLYASY